MATLIVHGRGVPPSLSGKGLDISPKTGDLEGLLLEAVERAMELEGLLLKEGKLRTDITVLVNGRHCMFIDGLKTKLADGDRVEVLLPMIGG